MIPVGQVASLDGPPRADRPDLHVHAHTLVVLACGAAKAAAPREAARLYTSDTWGHFYRAADRVARSDAAYFGHRSSVVILSAKHGLVDPECVLAPYDTTMGQQGCIGRDELVDQLVHRAPACIMSLLPGRYWSVLRDAVDFVNEEGCDSDPWIELLDVYEPGFGPQYGVGFQRGVASKLLANS
jgi:hypothetical protein